MRKKNDSVLTYILIIVFSLAISWGITAGLIKLISMCFHFQFTFSLATGIWLIMCLIRTVIHKSNK